MWCKLYFIFFSSVSQNFNAMWDDFSFDFNEMKRFGKRPDRGKLSYHILTGLVVSVQWESVSSLTDHKLYDRKQPMHNMY